jgi:glucose-1-phosphate thymidylyltransferase
MVRLNAAVLERTTPRLGGIVEAGAILKGKVSVGKDTVIRSNSYIIGPVVIGEDCEIGPSVCILPSTSIGDNVSIGPFTAIENSVIGDDVSIGPTCIIEDSVIDKGCVIRGHFTASSGRADVRVDEEHHEVNIGAMLGIGNSLGSNVLAEPGTVLGNYSEVQSMKVLRGNFPDRSRVF